MADRLEWFELTIPANTPIASPHTFPCVFTQGYVVEIDVKVPPGPSGNVGFFIAAGGTQYVPRTIGSVVIPDNDRFTWPLTGGINSGSWSVVAYNTDIWPHTIQVGFQVDELWSGTGQNGQVFGSSSGQIPASVVSAQTASGSSNDPLSADSLISSVPSDVLQSLGA